MAGKKILIVGLAVMMFLRRNWATARDGFLQQIREVRVSRHRVALVTSQQRQPSANPRWRSTAASRGSAV